MYQLKVHNDGKEKWQSFKVSLFDTEENDTIVTGYGENLLEAYTEMQRLLDEKIMKLQHAKSIGLSNFIWVDCCGVEIVLKKLNK